MFRNNLTTAITDQNVEVQFGEVDSAFRLTEVEELGGAVEQKVLELRKLSLAAVPEMRTKS
jgi:L-arabinose isomerase